MRAEQKEELISLIRRINEAKRDFEDVEVQLPGDAYWYDGVWRSLGNASFCLGMMILDIESVEAEKEASV